MSYANPITPVSGRYGAPMGRFLGPDALDTTAGRIYLRRIPINSQGYDSGGAYWGIGQPLWHAHDQDGNGRIFRARNRAAAKLAVLDDYPDARFFQ
jgi:hypothetical protein